MNRSAFVKTLVSFAVAAILAPSALAQGHGTKEEAKALADAAAMHVKSVGKEKAYSDFSNDKAKWSQKDLYVFVFDMKGNVLAHGGNAKLVGQNLSEMRDDKGRSGALEMAKIAKTSGTGWYDYEFINPVTQKPAAKTSYVVKLEGADAFAGVGFYR